VTASQQRPAGSRPDLLDSEHDQHETQDYRARQLPASGVDRARQAEVAELFPAPAGQVGGHHRDNDRGQAEPAGHRGSRAARGRLGSRLSFAGVPPVAAGPATDTGAGQPWFRIAAITARNLAECRRFAMPERAGRLFSRHTPEPTYYRSMTDFEIGFSGLAEAAMKSDFDGGETGLQPPRGSESGRSRSLFQASKMPSCRKNYPALRMLANRS
jgi:hypothetical protein